jgi:uncharacterized protein YidB (DUF937 family)
MALTDTPPQVARATPFSLQSWHLLLQAHQGAVAAVLAAAGGDPQLAARALAQARTHGLRPDPQTVIFWAGTLSMAARLVALCQLDQNGQGGGTAMRLQVRGLRQVLQSHARFAGLPQVKLSTLNRDEFGLLTRLSDQRRAFTGASKSKSHTLPERWQTVERSLFRKLGVASALGAQGQARAAGAWNADAYNQQHPPAVGESLQQKLAQFSQFAGVKLTSSQFNALVAWVTTAYSIREAAAQLGSSFAISTLELDEVAKQFGMPLRQLRDEMAVLAPQAADKLLRPAQNWPAPAKKIFQALQQESAIQNAGLAWGDLAVLALYAHYGFQWGPVVNLLSLKSDAVKGTLRRAARKAYPGPEGRGVNALNSLLQRVRPALKQP